MVSAQFGIDLFAQLLGILVFGVDEDRFGFFGIVGGFVAQIGVGDDLFVQKGVFGVDLDGLHQMPRR